MALFRKRNNQLEDHTNAPPKVDPIEALRVKLSKRFEDARWGSRCRTLSFQRSGNESLGTQWLEACRNPENNTWLIQRCERKNVTLSKNSMDVKGPGITQNWLMDDQGYPFNDLSFYNAIIKLAEYEATQSALGWEPAAEPTEEQLSSEYYRTFALNEGLVFDRENTPHPTDAGQLLMPGTFLEEDYNRVRELTKKYDPLNILKGSIDGKTEKFNESAQIFFADIIYLQQVRCYLSLLQHYAQVLEDNPVTEALEHVDFKTRKTVVGRIDQIISGTETGNENKGAYYEFVESQNRVDKDSRVMLISDGMPLHNFYEKLIKLTEFYTDLFMAISQYRAMVRHNASDPETVLETIEETEINYKDIMGPNAQPGFIKTLVLQTQSQDKLVMPGLENLIKHIDQVCTNLMNEELRCRTSLSDEVNENIKGFNDSSVQSPQKDNNRKNQPSP